MKKVASVVLTVTTVVWLSGVVAFVPRAQAQSTSELQAQIATLLAQITALQAQLNGSQGGASMSTSCSFTRDLTVGSTGDDVKCLQQVLNHAGYTVSASGAGSPGNESSYFGLKTKAAVAAWQAAVGISPTAGYFGAKSRAKYAAMVATNPPTPPGPPGPPGPVGPPAPAGTGLTVSAGVQPATGGLHPNNAVRVPYTAVVFTASSDGDVKVNSLTVERQGASTDATFSGVVLLDNNGIQVGLEKTLNSNHQAILTEPFTIPRGTSRTMWIAGNRTTGGSNGLQASFALVAVSSTATVSGTLPIVGTTRTINTGLTIGDATLANGVAKSVATTTEDAGKTMIFTAVKVTAGSVEDVSLKSIRFNQVGTIGANDITGTEIKVDGTVYPHTVSSDGKYFTATFANGITVTKGNSVEVTIGGTLSGGTNRTIKFDVYRMTDVSVDGKLYGYGINPSAGTGFTSTNPVYWASQVTVGKATLLVEKDVAVAAQNIAINLADQPLGGFTVDVKGEPISVASIVFNLSTNSTETAANIDQIKLVGPTGNIVAGPVDGAGTTVTFTDTVTFPVGKGSYKLVGKLDTTLDNNDTVAASTTPSSNWTTVTGQTTGETITPSPSSAVTANTMTVKASSLTITTSVFPLAQTVVSGLQQFVFANYIFDASQSGEDVRMQTIPLAFGIDGGNSSSNLTSCQLFDGTTSKTTGSNVVNPTAQGSTTTFTFDGSGITFAKGTSKTLALKCNIAGGATGNYMWGLDGAQTFSATGLVSGQSLTPGAVTSNGQKMTLASGGSYTVTDDSTPGYRLVTAGSTGVVLARLKFSAFDEAISIQRVNFQLTTTASNTPNDLAGQMIHLYDEAAPTVEIGTGQFGSGGAIGADMATSTPTSPFIIPSNGSKVLLVKGDIAAISQSVGPLVRSGDLLKVDYDGTLNAVAQGNYGTGQSSGTSITPSSADTSVQGVRIVKAYPVFTKLPVPSNVLRTQTNYTLYRFSVQAVGGDVRIFKLTFGISSTTGGAAGTGTGTTSKYSLYAYNNYNSSNGTMSEEDTTYSATGLLNAGQCYGGANSNSVANTVGLGGTPGDIEIVPANSSCASGTTTYKVPAGTTKYFDFRADVASVESVTGTESMTVTLRGDSAWMAGASQQAQGGNGTSILGDMYASGQNANGSLSTTVGVNGDAQNDFIWTPVSTTTSSSVYDLDYTNGYQVLGLPASDMSAETFTSIN